MFRSVHRYATPAAVLLSLILACDVDENGIAHTQVHGNMCGESGGRWNASLQACYCPSHRVFSVRDGCIPHDDEKRVDEAVTVGAGAPAFALVGVPMALGQQHPQPRVTVSLRDISESDLDLMIGRPVLDFPGKVRYDRRTLLGEGLEPERVETACLAMFAEQLHVDDLKAGLLCRETASILTRLQADSLSSTPFFHRTTGEGVDTVEYSMARVDSAGCNAIVKYVGYSGGVFTRVLATNAGRGYDLHLLLSPTGVPMGGKLLWSDALGPYQAEVLRERWVYFDPWFRPMSVHDSRKGNRENLRRAAKQWLASDFPAPATTTPLVTDGRATPVHAPMRAAILESSLGVEYPALTQRTAFRRDAVEKFLESSDVVASWFDGEPDPTCASAELSEDSHSLQVASLLAADLPNVGIVLVPMDTSLFWKPSGDISSHIVDRLEQSEAKVVNISMDLAEAIPDCQTVFDVVFKRFEDEILFVVAAGNDGLRNPASLCPAFLGRQRKNVMVVGGTNADGTIGGSNRSNYGGDFVDIAVPYHQLTALHENGGIVASREGGTSFAAPVVANAALRLLANYPHLSPTDLKAHLLDVCEQTGIDVACGGVLHDSL